MTLSRRFLYMVIDQCLRWLSPSTTLSMLHRIDSSPLFYPDGSASADRAANTVVDEPLPERTITFENSGSMQFSLMGRQKDKIVGVDDMGRAVLYDDVYHSVRPLPSCTSMAPPNSWRTLSVAVDGDGFVAEDDGDGFGFGADGDGDGDGVGADHNGSVYVIDADPLQPIQALMYERNKHWVWRALPPPPYVHSPGSAEITCHAVDGHREGDSSLVWVSTAGRGTYWLDTATHLWTKAGDWALPFRGQAVPASELGLWLGFSAVDRGHICASNLAAAVDEDRPPKADHVWDGFGVPEGFHELYSQVAYLGGRQFCVAKVFQWTPRQRCHCSFLLPPEGDEDKCFAMFTGGEVVHHGGDRYRMIKHRSLRYCVGESFSGCIL